MPLHHGWPCRISSEGRAQVPNRHLDWSPPTGPGSSERFSAGHLCHLLDIEVLGYQVRFRRTWRETCRSSPPDGYQPCWTRLPRQDTATQLDHPQTVEWLKVPSDAWQRRARRL